MLAAALSIRDPRERPEEQHRPGQRGAQALRRAGQRPAVDPRPVGPPARPAAGAVGQPVPPAVPHRVPQLPARARVARPVQPAAPGRRRPRHPAPQGGRPSPTASTRRCSPACCRTSGCATTTAASSQGARGSTFTIARGSVLARKPPRWVMAAELVETNRLWARRVATIEPGWAERLGEHLVRRSYGEPRWDERRAPPSRPRPSRCTGCRSSAGAPCPYDRIDRAGARGDVHPPRPRAAASGRRTTRSSSATGVPRPGRTGSRRGCGAGTCSTTTSCTVLRRAAARRRHVGAPLRPVVEAASAIPTLLDLTDDVLAAGAGFRIADYPDTWRAGRSRAAAVVPLRPRRAARRRRRARAADRAQPGDRRAASTGRSPATGAELVDVLVRLAAQGRPARADPDERDDRQGAGRARRAGRARSSTRWPSGDARSAGVRREAGDVRPPGRSRRTCG